MDCKSELAQADLIILLCAFRGNGQCSHRDSGAAAAHAFADGSVHPGTMPGISWIPVQGDSGHPSTLHRPAGESDLSLNFMHLQEQLTMLYLLAKH